MILSIHGSPIIANLTAGHIAGKMIKDQVYRAAVSTRSWITTNGLNQGVSALIGNARKEIGKELGDIVPIIGFPVWGDITNKEALSCDSDEVFSAREVNLSSKSNYSNRSNKSSNQLEPNHTHLLMYDHNQSCYNRDMFRFHFEAHLREHGKGGNGIPVVNILISGTLAEVQSVIKGLGEEIPLIVTKGSGGASDVIALGIEFIRQKLVEYRYQRYGEDLDIDQEVTDTNTSFRVSQKILDSLDSFQMNSILRRACLTVNSKEIKKWKVALKNILLKVGE